MRAVVYHRYGSPDVLEFADIEKPVVNDDEVLIKVHAASVNRSDWESLTARPLYVRLAGSGVLKPKRAILGSDIAGRVEAVGQSVTQFQPGDEVFGDIMWHGLGAFAEYVSVPERAPLAVKPAGMTFAQAAALPQAAVLGLQGLRAEGEIQPGHRVLINGAGGGAGSFAVQIAKLLGAEVTGVDSTPKLDTMRSIGADHVIDYTREDFTKGGHRYDRIIDFASHRSIFAYRRALGPEGIYLIVGGSMPRLLQAALIGSLISRTGTKHMGVLVAKPNKEDLVHLAGLVETKKIAPLIDRHYELSEVPEALRYLGEGHAKGKVVITL
ncbi:MAG: NAD(P)-dependent alcohol dehydrogenase [Acidimicrobiia bacterium]|nr:MAG: NAD(P)-dependent alcohol dehydrogenase [Acidimicrobiia bacterium]